MLPRLVVKHLFLVLVVVVVRMLRRLSLALLALSRADVLSTDVVVPNQRWLQVLFIEPLKVPLRLRRELLVLLQIDFGLGP